LIECPSLDKSTEKAYRYVKSTLDASAFHQKDERNYLTRISINHIIQRKIMSLQPALWANPNYKVKLITALLKTENYQNYQNYFNLSHDLSGTPSKDLMSLFKTAIDRDNRNLIKIVIHNDPLIFQRMNAAENLRIFRQAFNNKNYTLAEKVLSYPLDASAALGIVSCSLEEDKEIIKKFTNALIDKNATPFSNYSMKDKHPQKWQREWHHPIDLIKMIDHDKVEWIFKRDEANNRRSLEKYLINN